MKKILRKILPFMFAVILVSCGSAGSSSEPGENSAASALPEKVVRVENDRIVYYDLPSLLKASELVVIGEYSEDTEQKIVSTHNSETITDFITNATSTNRIHIKKVLKGDPPDEDIKISQRYGIQKNLSRS